jgi:methylmalonyl-CoA epimerase
MLLSKLQSSKKLAVYAFIHKGRGSLSARKKPMHDLELPLDHIAIAVPSIRAAVPLFELIAGATSSPVEHVESQHVDVAFIGSGTTQIELVEPTSPDSSVQRFLDKRGTGLHHIGYRVADVDATLARLKEAGFRLIDEKGRPGAGGHKVGFIHPASTNGILVELVEH